MATNTTIKYQADINGEERGGDDSEGDDEGGKGSDGDDSDNDGDEDGDKDGDYGNDNGGDGGDNDTKRRDTQQSNIKPTSTARNVVVTTARAMTQAARATVAGATRTTAAMAATRTPYGNKDNEDGISRRQQRRDIIHRSKSAGKRDRQLISRGGMSRTSFPVCWGGCRSYKPSRCRERRRA
jgi:hypothetical protein